jgi:GDPmannose 4,6-dehydratase
MTRRLALITGASGQDAHYLSKRLALSGYEVVGTSHQSLPVVKSGYKEIVPLDLGNPQQILALTRRLRPTHVVNLAARSSGSGMFDEPHVVSAINGLAVTSLLEAIREVDDSIRFFQASSSEMFGAVRETPQSEETAFAPRSPYGAAKLYAHHMVTIYRERYRLFACAGILFNHESPYRSDNFVSRKISLGAAQVSKGLKTELSLGNLEARRDWGFAGDFACAIQLMLEQDAPRDYVVGTGQTRSVREMCEVAFSSLGLDWRNHVTTDLAYVRPPEQVALVADPHRIETELGWSRAVDFEAMVRMMALEDVRRLELAAH